MFQEETPGDGRDHGFAQKQGCSQNTPSPRLIVAAPRTTLPITLTTRKGQKLCRFPLAHRRARPHVVRFGVDTAPPGLVTS